jgi:precorrin-3B synthase
MATGDGLLVRLHPPGGRLTAALARLVALAAHDCGNGLLDISARGNLQIRGIRDGTYPALAARLEEAGLVEPEGDGPHRLTIVSPLAGIDPTDRFDALALAAAIEAVASPLPDLPAKICIAIDGGGRMPLDNVGADLHVTAADESGCGAVVFGLASPDGPRWIGSSAPVRAPAAVLAILTRFAEMRRAGRAEVRRVRDLAPGLARELGEAAALDPAKPRSHRPPPPRAGLINLGRGHTALLAALPFGRCEGAQLARAAEWSEHFGHGEIRLSFTRGLLLPGLSDADAPALLDEARRTGFVVDAGDARLSLVACPGKPACAGARTPAPNDAARLASAVGEHLGAGVIVHVSACAKGCAHPGTADLTLVGEENGSYGVVAGGSSRDPASIQLPIDEIMTRLSSLRSPDDLGRVFRDAVP